MPKRRTGLQIDTIRESLENPVYGLLDLSRIWRSSMRFMRSRMKMATGLLAICAAFAVCIVSGTYLASVAYGQSLLAGDISGTIVDPNGAAVSGATVKVTGTVIDMVLLGYSEKTISPV